MDANLQHGLTEEQVEDARNLFVAMDKDGSGTLSKSEVEAAIRGRHENLSDTEINFMMRIIDLDRNDEANFDQFLTMLALSEFGDRLSELQMKQLFRAFDSDGNGVLSADELKRIWSIATSADTFRQQVSDEEMDKMIKAMDTNGDGQIDYCEFSKAFEGMMEFN